MSSDEATEQLDEAVTNIWTLIADARVYEARAMVDRLLRVIQTYQEDKADAHYVPPKSFAHAYHVAGYTASMSVRNAEAFVALQYFREMKHFSHKLQDTTLYVIALSYEGDTHRRLGDLPKALTYLQDAYTHTSQPDRAAHGNCAQLLGRIYFRLGDLPNFTKMMEEAEEIAQTIDPILRLPKVIHPRHHVGVYPCCLQKEKSCCVRSEGRRQEIPGKS